MNKGHQDNDGIPLETLGESVSRMQDSQGLSPARRRPSVEHAPPRAPRIFCAALLAAVIGLVTWETWANLMQHWEAAGDEDWAKAAQKVKAERKATEPVLFAPHWVDPMGRRHVKTLEMDMLTLSDVDRFPRVWQMSIRDKRHPWLLGLAPVKTWNVGRVKVEIFEKKPVKVLFDFTRSILKSAQVERQGHKLTRCPLRNKRFVCDPRQSWNWAGPHMAEVGHRPYRCIFVHPVDRQVMRVKFPSVLMGSSLVGYTGIDDFENRKRAKLPVLLTVNVGGKVLGSVEHRNEWDWRKFSMDTARFAGQTHKVTFEVATRGAFARTFCFSAETRK